MPDNWTKKRGPTPGENWVIVIAACVYIAAAVAFALSNG